jgi:hypothetical protein
MPMYQIPKVCDIVLYMLMQLIGYNNLLGLQYKSSFCARSSILYPLYRSYNEGKLLIAFYLSKTKRKYIF